ncbi:MbnP family protein [Spirosoma montaniterrae]|uniref:Copper-binding protein MbnP-like domain-containing protein n=1 Tax=Spirosoma montaniterrae TaxID=1178516 RepID=A0A1P9X4A7_9BACT|nr:MbnP family protein [Spirosoma montaniterrae]AQG82437.1 hypothetical protein AWR27_10985 [Spirosoma montaniterrae]
MRTTAITSLLLVATLTGGFMACKSDNPASATSGPVSFVFDNVVGNQDLKLATGVYQNGAGESFTPTAFNYFVSNITLTRADGSQYVVPQDSSYFLIKEDVPATQRITLRNVPFGDYKAMSFVLGVDSLRSTMDISRRTGVLDPAGDHTSASGMYWSWNSGYIFLKLEGTSPSAPVNATGNRNFRYHIGFFGGYSTRTINNLKTIRIPFGSDVATIAPGRVPVVTLQADVLKVFDGVKRMSINANSEIMVSLLSADVANNYAQMMTYKRITTATN